MISIRIVCDRSLRTLHYMQPQKRSRWFLITARLAEVLLRNGMARTVDEPLKVSPGSRPVQRNLI